jgi:hypothetical protein
MAGLPLLLFSPSSKNAAPKPLTMTTKRITSALLPSDPLASGYGRAFASGLRWCFSIAPDSPAAVTWRDRFFMAGFCLFFLTSSLLGVPVFVFLFSGGRSLSFGFLRFWLPVLSLSFFVVADRSFGHGGLYFRFSACAG